MFIKVLKLAAIFCALFMVVAPANAQNENNARFVFGGGVTGGDPDLEFNGTSGSLPVENGMALTVGVWLDKVGGMDWLSLGGQFLHLSGFDFDESGSGTVLGATVSGTLTIEPTINAFMANVAARQSEGKFHPYIGGGFGFAQAEADATASATLTVGGTTWQGAGSTSSDDTGLAWQVFAGLDYDISDQFSIGANVGYFRTSVNLFETDVDFQNVTGMVMFGIKF